MGNAIATSVVSKSAYTTASAEELGGGVGALITSLSRSASMRELMLITVLLSGRSYCQFYTSGSVVNDSGYVTMAYALAYDPSANGRIFKAIGEGAFIEFYPNRNARMATVSVPGTVDRIELWWFDNGALMSERVIRDNDSKGYVKYWFQNGQIKFWAELLGTGVNGRALEWSEEGKPIRDEIYRNGKVKRARIPGYRL